ncbi:MAG: hypothetical protein NC087_03125 [Anaeroplasma bactoclasticum]|nr:hypothetical protein [Anaeroplasma bactoclasticum]
MEYIANKEMVVIFNKRMGLETIASKLALLNGEQTKKFFNERPIKIPRKINAMALTSALNERIKTLDSHSLSRDAFINLESYATFTEFQLQNLFEKIGTDEDYYLYRKNLWKLLIINHVGINLQDGEITRLINAKKYKFESFMTYSKAIFAVTLDLTKEFDAYPINKLDALLKDSFSQEEIRLLGLKYGFDIPARLKKEDLLSYVKAMMKARKQLPLALQRELNEMTITQLNEYSSLQGLGISSLLKKEELINLFLFLVKQAKYPHIAAGKIIGADFAEPLQFRVDLDAIDNFKRGKPKKVIYLESDELEVIKNIDDLAEELEVKTTNQKSSKEELVTEVIQKLLPYLNIDEESARTAIHYGISIPKPKKTTATKKTIVVEKKKTVAQKNTKAPVEQKTIRIDKKLVDEILDKIQKLRQSNSLKQEEIISASPKIKKEEEESLFERKELEAIIRLSSKPTKKKYFVPTLGEYKEIYPSASKQEPEEFDAELDEYDDTDEFDSYNFEPEEDEEIDKVQPSSIPSTEEYYNTENITTASETQQFENDEFILSHLDAQSEEMSKEETSLNSTLQNLENESYDEEFAPKNVENLIKDLEATIENGRMEESNQPSSEETILPSFDEEKSFLPPVPAGPLKDIPVETQATLPTLEINPYFGSRKMKSSKKPIILSIVSVVVLIGVFISIFAILNAFK